MKLHPRLCIWSLGCLVGFVPVAVGADRPTVATKDCGSVVSDSSPREVSPPVIALQVLAPAKWVTGEELVYRILVENRSRSAAHHVVIHDPVPPNTSVVRSNPPSSTAGPELQWRLGTMEGGARREIQLVLTPTAAGDIENCVRVTFEHGLCVTTRMCKTCPPPEPPPPPPPPPPPKPTKPVLRLGKRGPAEARVGDVLTYQLTITNVGDGPARNVELRDVLPVPLSHSSGQRELSHSIPMLAPGESRAADYQVTARAPGRHCNKAVATADGGLREEIEHCVNVTQASISLTKTGPKQGYVNRPVTYRLTVTNTGTAAVNNVVIADRLPAQTRLQSATANGRVVGDQVQWLLGTIEPGGTRSVDLTVVPLAEGEIVNPAQATADRGLQVSAQARTRIEGLAGLLLEVTDKDDPLEVNGTTYYNIIVKNQGSTAQSIVVEATAPKEMYIVKVESPPGSNLKHRRDTEDPKQFRGVRYDAYTLPPGKDAVYRVYVIALKPADARFKVEVTSDKLKAAPVTEFESTNIYDPDQQQME